MKFDTPTTLRTVVATFIFALAFLPATLTHGQAQLSVGAGQKMKIKGVVKSRTADNFVIQDSRTGAETAVVMTDRTSVKTKGGFFGGGTNLAMTSILRGLNLEVEGRGDSSGHLVAEKIRFSDKDLQTAKTVEMNVVPVENRVGVAENRIGESEQNAQRLAGQIDELAAVSNAARGGAVAAQETADRAVEGVRVANDRIASVDDFNAEKSTSVNFKLRSAILSPEAKQTLDEIATYAKTARGFVIEVTGYAYESRNKKVNEQMSEKRAESVVRYLVENHNIPLRRIITPFGYGSMNPVADNTTREGRAENRRAEIRVLVSRGLAQPGDMSPSKVSSATP
jgi:outer membrane protein OmpA-like peptidoglycan-associated protein